MAIERKAGRTAEEGLGLYMARWGVEPEHVSVRHIVEGLGFFDGVADDEALPVSRDEIVSYWHKRQPELIRNLGRFRPRSRRAPQPRRRPRSAHLNEQPALLGHLCSRHDGRPELDRPGAPDHPHP
jgi:hypothetical protein